jgi:hypothetical protein
MVAKGFALGMNGVKKYLDRCLGAVGLVSLVARNSVSLIGSGIAAFGSLY